MAAAGTLNILVQTQHAQATAGLKQVQNSVQETHQHIDELGHGGGMEALGEKLEHVGLHALGLNRHLIGLVTHFGAAGIAAAGAFIVFESIVKQSEEHEKALEKIEEHWKEIEKEIADIQREADQFGWSKQEKQVDSIRRKLEAENEEIEKANKGWWSIVSAQAELLANGGGESDDFWENVAALQTPLKDVAEELEKAKKAAEQLAGEERFHKAAEAIQKYKDHVKELKETEGKSKGEIELYKLKVELMKQGAEGAREWRVAQEQLQKLAADAEAIEERAKATKEAEVEATRKQREAEQERLKDLAEANRLRKDALTPEQKYQEAIAEINRLKEKGLDVGNAARKAEDDLFRPAREAEAREKKAAEDRAKSIVKESLTKKELLELDLQEIENLKKKGLLTEEQADKASEARKAKDEEKEKKEHHKEGHLFAGATQLGSEETRSSILQGVFGNHTDKVAENTKVAAVHLKDIKQLLKNPGPRMVAVNAN